MQQSIKLTISDDTMQVEIDQLVPGCTVDDIRDALSKDDITTGIQWNTIEASVKKARDTNTVLHKVLIAESGKAGMAVTYGRNGRVLRGNEIETMRNELAAIGRAIKTGDVSTKLANGIFVKSNETALMVNFPAATLNVFGNEVEAAPKPAPFSRERCVAVKTNPDGYQMIALVTGYFVVNAEGNFDIVDPFLASDDKLILYCYVAPLIHGRDSFIDKVIKSAPPSPALGTVSHFGNLSEIEVKDHLYKLELRRGKVPVPGRPGSIRFFVTLDDILKNRHDKRIDYHEVSCFKEIEKGTLLAERIPAKQSIPGMNVFGDPLEAPKVKDIIFSYGNGVEETYTPDLVQYFAKERGVLEMNSNYLNIVPELIIHGDVGNFTGNIRYSRSVQVKGTILSGFKVDCGELTVRDSIEDGVEINCTGNLYVSKGILGERTKVSVGGDAKVGLIQSASLRVQGDCTIEEYAYHSKIYCGKKLIINGKGASSSERGCVLGGTIGAINCMEVHSVGSVATLTTLCCGFDQEGYALLLETVNLEKTLKKKIMQLQNTIHFNPNNKDQMLQKINLYSDDKRDQLKRNLQELRNTITQVDKAGASIALLSRKVFSPDLANAYIRVSKHVIAPVLVEFPKLKKKIYREAHGVRLSIIEGEIAMYEGLTNQGQSS